MDGCSPRVLLSSPPPEIVCLSMSSRFRCSTISGPVLDARHRNLLRSRGGRPSLVWPRRGLRGWMWDRSAGLRQTGSQRNASKCVRGTCLTEASPDRGGRARSKFGRNNCIAGPGEVEVCQHHIDLDHGFSSLRAETHLSVLVASSTCEPAPPPPPRTPLDEQAARAEGAAVQIRQRGHDLVEAPRARKARQRVNPGTPHQRVFPPGSGPTPSSQTQRTGMPSAAASHIGGGSPTEHPAHDRAGGAGGQPGNRAVRTRQQRRWRNRRPKWPRAGRQRHTKLGDATPVSPPRPGAEHAS